MTQEESRLQEARKGTSNWKEWGPYLSERQWGTVHACLLKAVPDCFALDACSNSARSERASMAASTPTPAFTKIILRHMILECHPASRFQIKGLVQRLQQQTHFHRT
jgi:hypothetical protein